MAWKIVNWEKDYEDARSIRIRNVTWVRVPVDTSSSGYITLVKHKDGASHLGAWRALQGLAAKHGHTGEIPYEIPMISEMTRLPKALFAAVIPRLVDEIGWLVKTGDDKDDEKPQPLSQEGVKGVGTFSDILGPNGTENVPSREGKGREGKGREGSAKRQRDKDEIWDSVCEVCGITSSSRTSKKLIGRVVRDLKERGATVEEIRVRAKRYHEAWPTMSLTPTALEKNWDEFNDDNYARTQRQGDSGEEARVREGAEKYNVRGQVIDGLAQGD